MDLRLEWLNEQIDLMQAERRLDPGAGTTGHRPDAGDVAVLRMAAQLNARRPGAGQPDPDFLERLRLRLRASLLE